MIRVKLLSTGRHGKKGEVVSLSNNEAFGLIDSGQAELTKDMTQGDMKTKSLDEEQANGITSKLRAN